MGFSQRTFVLLSALLHCSFLAVVASTPLPLATNLSHSPIRFRITPPVLAKEFSLAPSVLTKGATTKPELNETRKPSLRMLPVPPTTSQSPLKDHAEPPPSPVTQNEKPTPLQDSVQEQDDYLALVLIALENTKQYPRRALRRRVEGTALLSLEIARTGEVLKFSLERSSGSDILDQEVREMVERARPFPPFPPELTKSEVAFSVPVQFQMSFR